MKRFVFGIALPLLVASFVAALGSTANAQEKTTLRMAVWLPPVHHLSHSLQDWADEVEKASLGLRLRELERSPNADLEQNGEGSDRRTLALGGIQTRNFALTGDASVNDAEARWARLTQMRLGRRPSGSAVGIVTRFAPTSKALSSSH